MRSSSARLPALLSGRVTIDRTSPQADGLVGCWPGFGPRAGRLIDLGSSLHSSVLNVPRVVDATMGPVPEFGSTAGFSFGNSTILNAPRFSTAGWIRTNDASEYQFFMARD